MFGMSVRVGVNGFGTIGKRVAYALLNVGGVDLVGVVKKTPDYSAMQAAKAGIRIYTPGEKEARAFEEAGLRVEGTLEDLLGSVDVIVDATPNGVGESYKPLYTKAGVKQVYQGGEKAGVAEVSFSSLCNYGEAVGRGSVRVVSCNTTGLLRLICTLDKAFGVEKVRAVLIRRAADPKEVKKGPINSINLNPPSIPSHHAHDVKTVVPKIDIVTAAVVVPTTLMHVHHVTLRLADKPSRDEVLEVLARAPRIIVVDAGLTGLKSTAQLIDAAREVRRRADIPELIVFKDSITLDDRELMLFQAVHQESIVVPENVDAIKALTGMAEDGETAIKETDRELGLTKSII